MTDAARFAALDAAVRAGLGDLYPGAVVAVTAGGRLRHAAAFGHARRWAAGPDGRMRALAAPCPMAVDTIFDLASVTKVAAAAAALARLVGEGRLALDTPLGALLPGFARTDKAGVTVRLLLTHRAGLWEWQPVWAHARTPAAALRYLAALPRRYPVGERHAYSDLGFMLLGAIVARVAGRPLGRYVREAICRPLGLADTGFRPDAARRARCAATSAGDGWQRRMAESGAPFPIAPVPPPPALPPPSYRGEVLSGVANDANAALAWGGVAGHAGLFGTAADLLRLLDALLADDGRLAPPATLAAFEERPFDEHQAHGWRAYPVPGGATPFLGHPGYTGTFVAYSRALGAGVALLTNRLHQPDDRPPPDLAPLHARLLREAAAALGPDQRKLARKPTRNARPSRSE